MTYTHLALEDASGRLPDIGDHVLIDPDDPGALLGVVVAAGSIQTGHRCGNVLPVRVEVGSTSWDELPEDAVLSTVKARAAT